MSQDEFTRLFVYMEQRFDKIEAELAKKVDKAEFERVYAVLDRILKHQEAEEQERFAANHQLDRHERWIKKASTKLKIAYIP